MIPSKQRRPTRLATPLMVAVVVACAGGCKKAEAPPPPPPPTVEVAPVIQKDVTVYQEWIGTLDGFVNAEIRPQIEGYLLRQVYREGFVVKAGDTLFEIDPRQFQATLRPGEGPARPVRGDARQGEDRRRPATRRSPPRRPSASRSSTTPRRSERTAQANVETAQAALEKAKLNLAWTKVVSPIDGIAGIAKSQVGDLVTGQTVLTTVSQVDPIKVYFNPSEHEYLRWSRSTGRPRSRSRRTRNSSRGRSSSSSPTARVSRTAASRSWSAARSTSRPARSSSQGVFPNPEQPAAARASTRKVRAAIGREEGGAPRPAARGQRAAGQLPGRRRRRRRQGRRSRSSTLGPRDGSVWVIEKGLSPGDRVVVEGLQKVRSGMKVAPKEAAAASEAGRPGSSPRRPKNREVEPWRASSSTGRSSRSSSRSSR